MLSGDAEKTAYLYNGLLGVATDENGINMNTVTKELPLGLRVLRNYWTV